MPHLVIHSSLIEENLRQQLRELGSSQVQCYTGYCTLRCDQPLGVDSLEALSEQYRVDINILPESLVAANIGLLITDMDSTLINIECVDEIADFAGKKPEVSAITESAMRGELDFNGSLTRRVALLKGLGVEVLEDVYKHRLKLNPGAENLVEGLKQQHIKTALVSGGFTFFTDKLAKRLGFDYVLSNVLGIDNNRLTGEVYSSIVNADRKAQFLQEICAQAGISTKQAIAVGDGANDLKMMKLSGMSVAYRAKPAVRQQADIQINYSGLDSILHLLDCAKRII
jgi:phosphoserine phosphatase